MAAAILEKEHVPAPDEWKQTFTDPRLCTAIVDRVTFNAHIVETGTDSYRFAQTQKKQRRR